LVASGAGGSADGSPDSLFSRRPDLMVLIQE